MCVLLWILDSISVEPPNSIGQLRTCFLINDLGGEKISEAKAHKIKERDMKWNNFKRIENKKERVNLLISYEKFESNLKIFQLKNYYKSTQTKGDQKMKRKVKHIYSG